MRILLTTHAFVPRSVAGVEVYTARLAEALGEAGHTVQVVTAVHDLAPAPFATRRRSARRYEVIEIVNPGLAGDLAATYRSDAMDRVLERLLDELVPECVHAQHFLNLSTGLADAAQRRQIPVILTLHDYWLSCPRDGQRFRADGIVCTTVDYALCARCLSDSPYLVPPLERGALDVARRVGIGPLLHALHRRAPRLTTTLMRWARRASLADAATLVVGLEARAQHLRALVARLEAVVAPTRFARERALEWGAPAETLLTLPLGAIPGPTRARPAGKRRRLGYLGTLAPHKGVHVLVEAVRGLGALTQADWSLDLFGNPALDPAYTRRLESLAAGEPRIRFRGLVPPEGQEALWSGLEALVLPSLWWENSPLAMLEALAAGRPVIASRIGGVPEIVPDGAGLLVPPGDVGALRQTLVDVVEGRLLAEPLAPLPLKTTHEGAVELVQLYERVRGRRRSLRSLGEAPRRGATHAGPRVGVVVLDFGHPQEAQRAARSAQQDGEDVRVLIVENGAGAEAAEDGRLRLAKNRGFAGGINAGLRRLVSEGCERLLLLNDDAELEAGCLARLSAALEDPTLAAVGPVIVRASDGRVESRGLDVATRWGRVRLRGPGGAPPERTGLEEVEALSGAVLMVSRAALERVGLLDEAYFFSFEDVDWCLRARAAGQRLAVVLDARARHEGSLSLGRASAERFYYSSRNHLRLVERHRPLTGVARLLRRVTVLARNLGYAVRQGEAPRRLALLASLAGFSDGCHDRCGPRRGIDER